MRVTFLGTAAGRPSSTRNVSSLAIQLDAQMYTQTSVGIIVEILTAYSAPDGSSTRAKGRSIA